MFPIDDLSSAASRIKYESKPRMVRTYLPQGDAQEIPKPAKGGKIRSGEDKTV